MNWRANQDALIDAGVGPDDADHDDEVIEHTKSITGHDYCGGCGQSWPCEIALLRAELERLAAWTMRAYAFIQAAPCRCGQADECEAHTLIHEYQEPNS